MIDRATVQSRRAALQAQLDQARARYDQLEAAFAADLKERDRQLCAMAGGVQELDALLSEGPPAPDERATEDAPPPHDEPQSAPSIASVAAAVAVAVLVILAVIGMALLTPTLR